MLNRRDKMRTRIAMIRILSLLLLGLGLSAHAQEMSLHVISRPDAEALVPVITPLLEDGGTVNAYQGKLIIRTSDRNFQELQSLLGELNSQPKAVTVFLRRAGSVEHQMSRGSVDIVRRPAQTNARIRVEQQRQQNDTDSHYQIRTLSGYPAGINQGTLMALSRGYHGVQLHSLERGIQLTPQVNTDGSVTLQIQQRYDQPGGPGIADTQHSATTLRLEPGSWQPVGAIHTVTQSAQQGIGRYQTSRQTVTLPIEVMVELGP